MGVLSLNVVSSEKGIKKTMQFEPTTLVFDAAKLIRDKFAMHDTNPSEYGLFRIEDEPSKCVWMENGRTLEYYLVRNQDKIEYKKKIRLLKVRMLDGAVKTISVDESQPVSQLMLTICNKIGIANYEEYSLVRDDVLLSGSNNNSTWNLRDDRSRSVERSGMMGTLGRKKEQKLEELRKKLHTDEELPWLDHSKTLREQNISEEETLLLRRKFFFSDTNVDSRDPVQLNLLYVQCRDGILRGLHPVQKETALHLAALQAHIEYGDFPYDKPKFHIDGRDVLPKEYGKVKENEKKVVQLYKELSGTAELDAKSKYVHLCRELKTYGVTFFVVKEKMAGKNKLVPRLLGVNKESVMRVDEKTKQILKEWPLEQVRRWASSGKTFNLDFGDYQDGYYSVQTSDGEKIGQLIGGYIDIILKKKRTRDHQGIEGDEGSTMLEDMVAPAKATLVAHGQIGSNGHNVTDGSVAVKGVLRTPQGGYGYGINGAQYGAVSGEITSQTLAKAQRLRIRDMYEHPQRALIGTIEATIRAVDEAEIELDAEPQIDIPKFNDDLSANRWVDEQMAVNKENVNERLAAMGAATAQVVQWTAVQEEYDDRVGTAIATIGSNLPDVSRNVRDLSALMSRDERGDLVEATRLLCGAFGDFLTAVNPEQNERRNVVFTAAGRVGEFSQQVINTMDQPSESQKFFDDHLVQKAKNVATSTAQLVMCAKTISAECDEPEVQEKVIQSATKCAFATSQLVACARVVAPTIDNSACQQQLTTAATEVSQSVSNLLHDSQYAVHEQSRLTDIHTAARQVTNALDSLLEHAKTSPKITTHREEEEEYNAVLRTTNRMIAHQGPSEELTREAKKVVRHSQILQEQFEHEAHQRPEDRDRLLDAARRVATATSDMIAATKECESRPAEVESERALRSAAERLGRVTNETTQEQQEKHIMQRLEQAAKQTAYDATQTIAASNASKDVISNKSYSNNLVYESTCTAEHLPRLITSIRESQNATTDSQKFRAQSRLIRDSHQVLETSVRLVETSRTAIPSVTEVHLASNLSESSNRLATSLAELRTAVNDAQQLNFSQQLVYSEELIRELDEQLINTQRAAIAHQLTPPPSATPLSTTSHLMSTSRHVGSGVAQLISAASLKDEKHVGASAVELAQYLRDFTNAVTEVVSTRTDVQLEKFIVSARSVVNETGRVFDRVRQMSPPIVLADTAKNVSTSLKQVIACIPDTEHIDKAIYKIQTASASSGTIAASSLRQAADRLIDATSQIVVTLGAGDNMKAVDVFVEAYCDLHASVIANIRKQGDQQIRQKLVERLENTQREAISVLGTLSRASVLSDATTSQQLTTETRQLTSTVNRLVEDIQDGVETPWEKECDAALRRIQSVYHVTQHADLPINDHGFFESLQKVSEVSHQLGEAMTGMARHAKVNDTTGFCQNVRSSADALCSLAEYASHSAYLVGISHPASTPGRAPLIDSSNVSRNVESVTSSCSRIESCNLNRDELLNETASVAKNTANLAQMCRNASEQTSNVNVKKHMVNSALELASKTANLVNSVKTLDSQRTPEAEEQCVHCCVELRHVAQQLLQFADNPDFAAIQANISNEGRYSQQPILQSSRQMLDTSADMIKTAKRLATSPQEAATWQRLADNSILVSESIKRLVASIHEAAPGQIELERAIARLHGLSGYVENAAMDAYAMASDSQHNASAEKQLLQQVQHITHSLEDKVDELRSAAVAHGERLPHIVEIHCQLVEDMANAACAAASMAVDSNKQTELFDKCRTVVEAELQLMIACQESGGNPNAKHAHRHVDDSAAQLKHVIGDMRALIAKVSNEREAVQGMVDTISSSIVHTDTASGPGSTAGSFADSQTRMTDNLEEIRRTAQHMQRCDANSLGPASLNLSEKYRLVAADVRGAVGMLPEADIGQKLKVAVQKLGTGCIETVKTAGQRRAHPEDERIHRELTTQTTTVVERVDQVLAALHEASRGTQACINAANTVSGIIGDLDTTIMFATSGSLNSADDQQRFLSHRDAILKTARALIEDTKALVAGAASNQEQLAVAAQNAVRTIVNLSDAVKNGAVSLSSDNSESQVLVIHAVRDVAAALSSLIQATKNASGKQLKDPAMEQLKEATKVMFSNVTSLLNTVKSVEDREHQGTIVLRAAVKAVTSEIEHYLANPPQEPSASNIQTELHPEHLQSAADNITQITRRIASNATADNLQTQEELSMVANMSRTAVRSLLAVVREVCNEIDDAKLRYQVFEGGRDVANNIKSLLDTLHTQMTTNIGHDESKSLLLEASRSVADALNRLIGACSEVSYANGHDEIHHDNTAAAAHAENELLGAASSIEAASLRLAELRPRQSIVQSEQEQPEEIEFDGQILSAAKSITSAVQTLVRAASNAQRELIAQGRLDTSRSSGPDYQWSEGLVSAARFVVAAVHQLCEAANGLVQGHASEEKLISAAKQVASSTAHLLVACNVKADMDSQAKKRLQIAGQAVKNATERLVQSARQIVSRDDRNIVISERLVSGIAQVMDAQEEVLRKEKELGEARHRLAHLNKARYERTGEE